MIIAVNGTLCDANKAVISAYDHGFLYGLGLFETFRTYEGEPFLLDLHLERLAAGCKEMDIAFHPDADSVRALVNDLLQANRMQDGYFRLSVSAGEEALGFPSGPYTRPNVILYVKELPSLPADLRTCGKPLQLLRLRRNTPEGSIRFKSFHYMNNILGKKELSGYPWAAGTEGLFLDGAGYVAEGLVSNVFFVRDERVYTPALETGILPGITRAWVVETVRRNGWAIHEGFYRWEDMLTADEAFLTNSIQEIVPVTRLFDQEGKETLIGGGTAGPLTLKLIGQYAEDTRKQ